MSKNTFKSKNGFTANQKLVMKHSIFENTRKTKENEINNAQYVIDHHSQTNTSQPVGAWKVLLKILKKELQTIECELGETARLIEKKHIDPSNDTYASAKATAKGQPSIVSFFKKPTPVEYNNRKVRFSL